MTSIRRRRPWRVDRRARWRPPWSVLLWTEVALGRLRRELPAKGLRAGVVEPLWANHRLTFLVMGWLRVRGATCLERSLILQRWLATTGRSHDVLIGVGGAGREVVAHAWLDHEDARGHEILTRVDPTRRSD